MSDIVGHYSICGGALTNGWGRVVEGESLESERWFLATDETRIKHGWETVGEKYGMALMAIQGLNEKLEEQVREKQKEIDALQAKVAKVDALEKAVAELGRRLGGGSADANWWRAMI